MQLVISQQVAAEVAAPLSQTKKITMVSTGSGEVGAAKLTGEVLAIVARIPDLVKQMTNIDISRVNQNHKYI
jgi:flotillin